jgi:hypothetical protein
VRSTLEVLEAARARISDPERWWQGSHSDSMPYRWDLPVDDERIRAGTRWSMGGSLRAEAESIDQLRALQDHLLFFDAEPKKPTKGLATFNDRHSHVEVLARMDAAIEALQRKESP